jgi:hypothetical protein
LRSTTLSRPLAEVPAERAQSRRQLLEGERLDQIVVGAGVQAPDPVLDGVPRGQHQDREARALRPHTAGDIGPGNVRQADVEHHGVDPAVRLGDLERLLARCRQLDEVPLLLEHPRQQSTEARVVLNEEQVHRSAQVRDGEGSPAAGPGQSGRLRPARGLARDRPRRSPRSTAVAPVKGYPRSRRSPCRGPTRQVLVDVHDHPDAGDKQQGGQSVCSCSRFSGRFVGIA